MTPRVWVFAICWNEAEMMPFFLRHYSTFAERIVIFDEQSTDGTRELIKACPVAELREWPHKGLDDDRFMDAVNNRYKEARGKADWVMWPDIDEFLYHPEPLKVLGEAKEDALPSTGYALISTNGFPKGNAQIYQHVTTGIRQPNYDKTIIWRPSVNIHHTHGRHSPNGDWPGCNGGVKGKDPKFLLLHCHHIGGIEFTRAKNQRNYERAREKRFAWNYSAEHNSNPLQVGSLAWVEDAVNNKKLKQVMKPPRKLHFGCGGLNLPDWSNYDLEVDIRKPLPFPNACASHILAEHVVEHVTHQEAWKFFEECWRVLIPGGVL